MKGRIRQRSPGTWQISCELGRDALGKRRTKAETIRGTKARADAQLPTRAGHSDFALTLTLPRRERELLKDPVYCSTTQALWPGTWYP